MSRTVRTCLPIAALVALTAALSACGRAAPEPPPAAGANAPGAPAILKRPVQPGELLVEGESSPGGHKPFRFDGRYTVKFAQYAPESPNQRFSGEVPFVAKLRSFSNPRSKRIGLFAKAAARGSRTIDLHGRYVVEVLFGDFPYVLRFTPAE